MTTYLPIADSDVDPESPITTSLMSALRDNPLAVAEGDSSAPGVKGQALVNTNLSVDEVETVMAAGATLALSVGLYFMQTPGSLEFQIQINSAWVGIAGGEGGMFASDGTNMRVENTSGSTSYTLKYRRYY